MLIRWATEGDLDAWEGLSREYDEYIIKIATDFGKWYQGFSDYMKRKIEKYEAVAALDRMTENFRGVIAFSRAYNRITFFAVSPRVDREKTARGLLTVALRQLNTNKDITVNLPDGDNIILESDRRFFEKNGFVRIEKLNLDGCPMIGLIRKADDGKRGGSFHYLYPEFIKAAGKENCPACNNKPMPDGHIDIVMTDKICVGGEYPGQGRLFGKCFVMPMEHYFHFEDMPASEAAEFMNAVQRVGSALRKITGAEKINYEIHSNSGAHLHIHLFPRYLDDDFPSAPIDYRVCEPAPYESYEEYLWFVEQMRHELVNL